MTTALPQEELDLGLPPRMPDPDLSWPSLDERGTTSAELPRAGLNGFTTGLFVQARASEARDTRRLVQYTGVGAVFTLERRRGERLHQALGAVDFVRSRASTNNILIDHGLYSGRSRKRAVDGLSRDRVREQLEILNLPWALTDSGFISQFTDVAAILEAAAVLEGNVIVALPMDYTILRDRAGEIVDLINAQNHPVALILQHLYDPFDAAGVVPALAHVITNAAPEVLLLRSDTSALGALAHGAALGAIGTHSGLRHIYPEQKGGGRPEQLAFVIPELLGYFSQPRFEQAYLRDPRQSIWRCTCWFCAERDLVWVGNQPEALKFRAAFQHSVSALSNLGAHLSTPAPELSGPAQVWSAMCAQARIRHQELAGPRGATWRPKAALAHWEALTSRRVTA